MDTVLFWNLSFVLVGVLTLAVAAALLTWAVRRGTRAPVATAGLSRADLVGVSLVGAGGLVAVPVSLVGLVTSAVNLATARSVVVTDLPVAGVYPEVLRASDAPVDASYSTAWVDVANLPGGARMLLWWEGALPLAAGLVIGLGVAWLAIALLRNAPFVRALPIVIGAAAIAVMVAGMGSQLLGAIARAETVAFLGPPEMMTGDGGFAAFSVSLDLGPLGWGLGLALVAAAFSIGTRLQRDVRGLV